MSPLVAYRAPGQCDAGRRAFFGGRWQTPCDYVAGDKNVIHVIGAPGLPLGNEIRLCPKHFEQVADAGLSPREAMSEDEYRRITRESSA